MAFHGKHFKQYMKVVRRPIKRAEAEYRNEQTPVERTKAYRRAMEGGRSV